MPAGAGRGAVFTNTLRTGQFALVGCGASLVCCAIGACWGEKDLGSLVVAVVGGFAWRREEGGGGKEEGGRSCFWSFGLMTLSLVRGVPVVKKRKEVEGEVEDIRACSEKKRAAGVQEAEDFLKPGMAAVCLAEFSQPKFVGMGEYTRSTSLSRSGGEMLADEVAGEFLEAREESREEERASVPSVPDSWAGDQFLHAGDAWETGSLSVVPLPIISDRDSLQRHRLQVAGHVAIPDTWAGEQHLVEWIDTEEVEEGLRPLGLMMARAALINEHSKGNGSRRVRKS